MPISLSNSRKLLVDRWTSRIRLSLCCTNGCVTTWTPGGSCMSLSPSFAGRRRRDAQMCGDARPDVGQAVAPTEGAAAEAGAEGENRHVFTRVVGTAKCRIIAVVGGNDDEIAGPQCHDELRQAPVESFEAIGVAGDVAAVAEVRVEVDEVAEDETALG